MRWPGVPRVTCRQKTCRQQRMLLWLWVWRNAALAKLQVAVSSLFWVISLDFPHQLGGFGASGWGGGVGTVTQRKEAVQTTVFVSSLFIWTRNTLFQTRYLCNTWVWECTVQWATFCQRVHCPKCAQAGQCHVPSKRRGENSQMSFSLCWSPQRYPAPNEAEACR